MDFQAIILTLWILMSLIFFYAILKVLFALADYLNAKSDYYLTKSDEITHNIDR